MFFTSIIFLFLPEPLCCLWCAWFPTARFLLVVIFAVSINTISCQVGNIPLDFAKEMRLIKPRFRMKRGFNIAPIVVNVKKKFSNYNTVYSSSLILWTISKDKSRPLAISSSDSLPALIKRTAASFFSFIFSSSINSSTALHIAATPFSSSL